MSALSDLLKKNNKSKLPVVAATAVTATVVAFSFAKMAGNEAPSSASSASAQSDSGGSSVGFANNNLVVQQPSSSSGGGPGLGSSTGSGSASSGVITDDQLEDFIPPEGIVARDGKGNVIYKRCRKLTEGQVTAKAEMEKAQARYDKFKTAMNKYTSPYGGGSGGDYGGDGSVSCQPMGKKIAPESPCPTYQEYQARRDLFNQQYYDMSNQLQKSAALFEACKYPRDKIMAAVDPDWRNDRAIASEKEISTQVQQGAR